MSGAFAALGLLTRFPVSVGHAVPASATSWFPVVGGLIGCLAAGVYWLALGVLPSFLAATVAVLAGIAVTGAIHEDGLADTFDALGARGGRVEAMEVLKDPRLGSYGVVALIASVALRTGSIAVMDPGGALAMLVCAHALARALPVVVMASAPSSQEGLGAFYSASVTGRRAVMALVVGVIVALLGAGIWALVALPLAGMATILLLRPVMVRIGVVTGDVLGAVEQVCEIVILLLGAAVISQGWTEPAWWR